MGDLIYLLKWLRRNRGSMVRLQFVRSDGWNAFAIGPYCRMHIRSSTPLRALRALAQQIRQQEET